MSKSDTTVDGNVSVYRSYVLDVRIVEQSPSDADTGQYRFEAPEHEGIEFDDPELAELYADVYFDTNGFQEAGTGQRGVPPEVVQAGRDTLAAYFLTQSYADINWIASFYGKTPSKIRRYTDSVRKRGREIRAGVRERELG